MIDYTDEEIEEYRGFVHRAACYNTRTATDILTQKKCRLYSSAKIREMLREFMKEREDAEQNKITDSNPTYVRALILITIASKLPANYSRIGGSMIICALAEFLTIDEIQDQIYMLEKLQDHSILWTESVLNACLTIKQGIESVDDFIEEEAEKNPATLSFMRDEPVEITFID